MSPICTKCADKFRDSSESPIEPCAVCKSWVAKFIDRPEIKELDKFAELVAKINWLQIELEQARAKLQELDKGPRHE